jgi:Cu-processing system permease protein
LAYEQRTLHWADLVALQAVYFILLQLAMVVALALLFSCFSTPILSAVFTLALYMIGNLLSDIRWFGQEAGSALAMNLTALIYYLLPNFGNFNVISQIAQGQPLPSYLLVSNSLYALLYVSILLAAAILIFEEREFR